MKEPVLVRCSRCDALVALQDGGACETHDTGCLCPYCWKHHVRVSEQSGNGDPCWSNRPVIAWL